MQRTRLEEHMDGIDTGVKGTNGGREQKGSKGESTREKMEKPTNKGKSKTQTHIEQWRDRTRMFKDMVMIMMNDEDKRGHDNDGDRDGDEQ